MSFRLLLTAPEGSRLAEPGYLNAPEVELLVLPLVEIVPVEGPEERAALARAAASPQDYDFLVLTSKRAIDPLLAARGPGGTEAWPPCLCIGEATAAAAKTRGLAVAGVAATASSEGLWELLATLGLRGKRLLFPRSREGRELLVRELARAGAEVVAVPAYGPRPRLVARAELERQLQRGLDGVAFTSSSTVEAFAAMLPPPERALSLPPVQRYFCIGPATAKSAGRHGFEPLLLASPHDASGMRVAILEAATQPD